MKLILPLVLVMTLSLACNAQDRNHVEASKKDALSSNASVKASKTVAERFYGKNDALDKKVDSLYNTLSNQQRAAQMIMVASSEVLGFPYATKVKPAVSKEIAGNVLFLKGNKSAFINQNKELNAFKIAGLKPLYACDCEPTLLHNKFAGQAKMNATANLKTTDAVKKSVDTINKVMDDMGILINFAPIVDIAANKAIISNRAFGNNSKTIIPLATEFVKQTQDDNKAATIKHFPGHGAVVGDTHKQSVSINGPLTELNTFTQVLEQSHPLFVMVGHIAVKNNAEGYNTENGRPATTSHKIITELLREKLNFKGIIVTDAMNMQASKNFPNADWEAAKAGADLILMPLNATKLNQQIAATLAKKEDHLAKQFEASVKRILRLKVLSESVK